MENVCLLVKFKKKMRQQISKSRIQTDCLLVSSDVFIIPNLSSDAIVNTDEQKPDDNPDLASLLIRALNKLANSVEYNGVVEDVYALPLNTKYGLASGRFYTTPKNRKPEDGNKYLL